MIVLVWLPVAALLIAGRLLGVAIPSWLLSATALAALLATFAVALLSERRGDEAEERGWWRAFW